VAKHELAKELVAETKATLETDGTKVTAKAIRDRAGVAATVFKRLFVRLTALPPTASNVSLTPPCLSEGNTPRFSGIMALAQITPGFLGSNARI